MVFLKISNTYKQKIKRPAFLVERQDVYLDQAD